MGDRERPSRAAAAQSALRRHDAGVLALLRCRRRPPELAAVGTAELRQGRPDANHARRARRAGGAVPKRRDVVMRSQSDSFDVIARALDAAETPEADALFVSTD